MQITETTASQSNQKQSTAAHAPELVTKSDVANKDVNKGDFLAIALDRGRFALGEVTNFNKKSGELSVKLYYSDNPTRTINVKDENQRDQISDHPIERLASKDCISNIKASSVDLYNFLVKSGASPTGVLAQKMEDVIELGKLQYLEDAILHWGNNKVSSESLKTFYSEYLPKAITLMKNEPIVKTVVGQKIAMIGDTHGGVTELKNILNDYPPKSKEHPDGYVLVFLGDYVDRSDTGAEFLAGLLLEKMKNPESVVLLRGDHESPIGACDPQEFPGEFLRKTGDNKALTNIYDTLWMNLSIAANIKILDEAGRQTQNYFAVHGGIPIDAPKLATLSALPKLRDPYENKEVFQCLWNDQGKTPNAVPSERGEDAYVVGQNEANAFRENNKIDAIFRGHEHRLGGFTWDPKTSVFTLQTTTSDNYPNDKPYVALLTPDKITIDDLSKQPAPPITFDMNTGRPIIHKAASK